MESYSFIPVALGFICVIACQLVGLRQQARMEARSERMEARSERMEASLGRIEAGIGRLEVSNERIEAGLGRIEAGIGRLEVSNERIEASSNRIEEGIKETRQVQQDIRMDTAVLADRVEPRDFATRAQGGRGSLSLRLSGRVSRSAIRQLVFLAFLCQRYVTIASGG